MSPLDLRRCPDWTALVRDEAREHDLAAWDAAVAHLDGGCDACFDRAVALEPTLLFRRLPRREPSEAELADLRLGVSALRRAVAVTGSLPVSTHRGATPRVARRRVARHRLLAAAAVALVSLAAGLLHGDAPRRAQTTVAQAALPASALGLLVGGPLVDDLAPQAGEVVQVVDAHLDLLVLVSDLDV